MTNQTDDERHNEIHIRRNERQKIIEIIKEQMGKQIERGFGYQTLHNLLKQLEKETK